MEPIIEINWTSLFEALAIMTVLVGVGMLVIRGAVAYSKKLRDREI